MTSRPYDHIDVVIGGTILSSAQGWSVQFTTAAADHSELPGDTSVGDLQAIATAVKTQMAGPGPILSALGSDVHILSRRAYLRKAGVAVAALVGEDVTDQGGAGTPVVPPQNAAVVTLLTGAAGRANRGRVYWPMAGATSRRITSSTVTALSTSTAALIAAIRVACTSVWGTAAGPVVGNNGLLVTRVQVDDVMDTQRRRRDKIASTVKVATDVPIP